MQGKLDRIDTQIERIVGDGEILLRPSYTFQVDGEGLELDPREPISLCITYIGGASCGHCEAPLTKRYGGNYCYNCFSTLARCDLCVMSPDRCHLHLGTCREPEWGASFCQQPHFVYVALSSGPKVGITRHERLERRWVDQGATKAIAIAQVPTRRAAGVVEASLRRHVSDRTDWRKMVTGNTTTTDLFELARQLQSIVPDLSLLEADQLPETELEAMNWLSDLSQVRIEYPVIQHAPAKRLRVDAKTPLLRDNLIGFLGGYVLLRSGVIPFADLCSGEIALAIDEPLPALAEPPQLDMF